MQGVLTVSLHSQVVHTQTDAHRHCCGGVHVVNFSGARPVSWLQSTAVCLMTLTWVWRDHPHGKHLGMALFTSSWHRCV
jgi:hypothetical protein